MTENHWPASLRPMTWEVVSDAAIDALIKETFGRPWSLQQNEMLGNDSLTWFGVFADPEASGLVEEWLASPPAKCPGRLDQPGYAEDVRIFTTTLLAELVNRGVLPEGEMRVYVSW